MLNVIAIGETYHKSTSDITRAIILTLIFRSVSAIIFRISGDRFGRKWSLIEIGIGNCTTTALDDALIATRGLLFGLLQQGLECGYIYLLLFGEYFYLKLKHF